MSVKINRFKRRRILETKRVVWVSCCVLCVPFVLEMEDVEAK